MTKKNTNTAILVTTFLHEVIDGLSKQKLNEFTMNTFFKPLGLSTMGYLPLKRLSKNQIIPTEFDYYYRSQLLRGHVHDMGAAMLGGVSGHAGLFSNANDLAILMQMYLQGGVYGGEKYFNESTINEYTNCQYCQQDNRRGAGLIKQHSLSKRVVQLVIVTLQLLLLDILVLRERLSGLILKKILCMYFYLIEFTQQQKIKN